MRLRQQGVRTILSLQTMPWDIWPESRKARHYGLEYRNVPILASPLEPCDEQVRQALLTLADPSLQPVFVHCLLGEDRNVFVVGLYRMYYQHWTPQAAWDEMIRSGFHSALRLRGFTTYFWKHTQIPNWVQRGGASVPSSGAR
ncbi:MAG TPA: hypothetical protein VG146_10555 [Verrucomicrobiae bacterium]|nr:hypothetical protein [Verrucomicrobiae bacterium]